MMIQQSSLEAKINEGQLLLLCIQQGFKKSMGCMKRGSTRSLEARAISIRPSMTKKTSRRRGL